MTAADNSLTRQEQPPLVLRPTYGKPLAVSRRVKALFVAAFLFFCLIYGAACAILVPGLIAPLVIPPAALVLLAVWALPDVDRPPDRTLRWLFMAFLFGLAAWPNYLAIALPGLPWITVIRLTGFPMVISFLVCVSVSKSVRTELAHGLKGAPWAWKLLCVFVCIQAVSIGFSSEKGMSIEKFVIDQVTWTAVFFISVYVFSRPGWAEKVAALLWILAVVVCVIGLDEHRHNRVPWVGHTPGFLKIESDLVQSILQGQMRAYSGRYRVQATFTTSIGCAEFLALTLPFIAHFMVESYSRTIKLMAAATVPVVVFLIYLTNARSGVVGEFTCVLLFPLIWAVLRARKSGPTPLTTTILMAYPAAFTVGLMATFLIGRVRHMFWGNGTETSSTEGRMTQYHMGIPKVFSHPWGYGIGRSADVLGFYQPGGLLTIDTYYLRVALDYGVIGFFVYYGLFLYVISMGGRELLRRTPDTRETSLIVPLVIALTAFVIIKSVFAQEDNHPIVFMMLGMLVALIHRHRTQTAAIARAAKGAAPKAPKPLRLVSARP